jgi:hypothetical protein
MRSRDEIIDECRTVLDGDAFDFRHEVLLPYLPRYMTAEFGPWQESADNVSKKPEERTDQEVVREMSEYIGEFGWPKAMKHRGLSAHRTVQKLRAWAWLLGRNDLVAFCDDPKNYPQYGVPILLKFSQEFGLRIPRDTDHLLMARGELCHKCVTKRQAGCGVGICEGNVTTVGDVETCVSYIGGLGIPAEAREALRLTQVAMRQGEQHAGA